MTFSDYAALLLVCVSFFVCVRVVRFVKLVEKLSPSRKLSKRKPDIDFDATEISASEAKEMIIQLSDWVRKQNADYLMGVHFSGLMLSSKIALDTGFDLQKLTYSENRKDRLDPPKIFSASDKKMSGRVCILDDISRQGLTLRQVANEIFSDFQRGRNQVRETCYGVLMLVETPSKSQTGFFLPDTFLHSISNENVVFPWTSLVERTRQAYREEQDGKEVSNPAALQDYKEMITNPEFAAFCIELAVDEPKAYEGCLASSFFDLYRIRNKKNDAA